MRRVWVGEAGRPENIEANEHFNVCYRPELTELDAPQNLLRGMVEDVVIVLDEMAAGLPGALGQYLQLLEGRGDRLFNNHMSASAERVHRQPKMGGRGRGDVNHIGPGLLQHGPVI